MQEQLKDYIEKIPSGFAFNLRYRPENLRKFDVLKPVDRKEPNVKTSYYTSLYNLKTIFKLEDHFVFQPGFRTEETDIDVKNGSSRRSHISKRHPVIQKALYDYLVKEYGKENVGTENLTPIGTEIDIVAKRQVLLASANLAKSLKNSFFGVEKPSFFLGLKFSFFATLRT